MDDFIRPASIDGTTRALTDSDYLDFIEKHGCTVLYFDREQRWHVAAGSSGHHKIAGSFRSLRDAIDVLMERVAYAVARDRCPPPAPPTPSTSAAGTTSEDRR